MQITPVNIQPVQTDAVRGGESGKSPFKNIREGQVVKAEVVAAEGGSLTLKLGDGTTVKAEFPGAQVMLPGDQLELTMLTKSDVGIHLRLTSVNGQQVHAGTGDLQVRLMDMGVQPSEINTKSAQFLVDRNIQPTPERVALLTRIATSFPELPASVALFMVANNIPATQKNVDALLQLLQGGQTVDGDVQQLITDVNQMLMEETGQTQQPEAAQTGKADAQAAVQGQQDEAALDPRTRLAALIAQLTGAEAEAVQPQGQATVGETVQPQPGQAAFTPAQQAVFQDVFQSVLQNASPENAVRQLPQTAVADFVSTLATMPEAEVQQAIEGFLSKFPLTQEQQVQASQTLQAAYQTAKAAAATVPVGQGEAAMQGVQDGVQQAAQQTNQPTQVAQADGTVRQGEQAATQQQGSIQQEGQPQAAAQQATATAPPTGTTAEGAAAGQTVRQGEAAVQEMRQVLQELGKFTVSLKRDVPADAENLQNALKNQQRIADGVQSSLARVAGEASGATQRAADMSSRIKLGNNMENFYYCQIPIEINQQKNSAELYVFERKRKDGGEGEGNTTILIALETQNMGRVETVLRAEQENLGIEFRVQSGAVMDYLQQTTDELANSLKSDAFTVRDIRIVKMEQPVTPLNVDQVLGEKEHFQLQAVDISI